MTFERLLGQGDCAGEIPDINNEKLIQRTQELRLGQRFTFQQDNNPAKPTQERLRDLNVSVHRWSLSSLLRLKRLCREKCQEILKSRSITPKKTGGSY